jgi:hypothetical protein
MRRPSIAWVPGLVVAVLTAALAPRAGAQTTYGFTLGDVTAGGQYAGGVVVRGWRYSDFTFRGEGPLAIAAGDVNVRISIADGEPDRIDTVRFDLYPEAAAAGDTATLFIDYVVTPHEPGWVSRVGLRNTGVVPAQGIGDGSLSVTEAVSTLDGSDLSPEPPARDREGLTIFNDGPGRLQDDNSDLLSVNLAGGVRLAKELTITARSAGPLAMYVADTISAIPEPAGAAVAAAAALWGLSCRPMRGTRRRVN